MRPAWLIAVTLLLPLRAWAAPGAEEELRGRQARWAREARTPEGVVAVLGALERWDEMAPERIAAFLRGAADTAGAHPLARAHATYLAWQAATRRGDADAGALAARLGIVERWRVIGPFGWSGPEAFATAYGPEEAVREREVGKRGEVAWREVAPRWLRHGVVPLGGLLRPDEQAAGYALAYVYSAERRDVAVRVGSTGRIKVWVAGRLALERDVAARPLRLDQDAGAARLEPGWNPVLVKVVVEDGAWEFLLRITAPDGTPLPLRAEATSPEGAPVVAEGGAPRARVVALRPLLEARAKAARGKAARAAWRDLALYLAAVAPDDASGRPVEAALAKAGWEAPDADAETLLAVMRHAETSDARRRAAERVRERKGATPAQRAEALVWLADYYAHEAGLLRRARELYEEALAVDPDHWPAALGLARQLASLGLEETAYERVAAVAAAAERGRARRELAAFERRRGRPEQAVAVLLALVEDRRDDAGLLHDIAYLERDRGRDAVVWLERAAAARPASTEAHAAVAEAWLDAGDLGRALVWFDRGLELAPDDARLLEASGRALVDRGGEAEKARGLERLKRALRTRPQNPELRRYLARVQPAADGDLERRYARKASELARRQEDFNKSADPATVLYDLKVVRVHDNGLSEVFAQRIVRIDDPEGAEALREYGVTYVPDTQVVEIRAARVHKPSGEMVEASHQDTREVSEPWYGLYYDVRADVVGFESLEPGDVVEVAYVVSDTGRRNLFAEYFGDVHFLAEALPRAETEYVLLGPTAREFHVWASDLPGLERHEDTVEGERRLRFRAVRVPKVTLEHGMPGWTEVAPYVHVSTYRSWDQVARWYWGLVKDQLGADDAVRQAARATVAGLGDERAKVRAIHNFVVKRTRYVGLEFGIHGWKPYPVPVVFARKFGDCKDKASLIVAMLREVGIEAHLALVRTRRNGDVGGEPASLAVFDHAIAHVPSLDLWLDGTAEFSGSEELPAEDQGVTALVIDGAGGRFTRTPVLPAERNHVTRTTTITLDGEGAARVREELIVRGVGAAGWRRYYQAAGDRRERYEKMWNALYPGARVERVEMPDLAELERPVVVRAEGEAPALARREGRGGGWSMPALGRPSELARGYARTSKRRHDLVLEYPWLEEETVTIELPAGATARRLPQAARLESPFGAFELFAAADAGGRRVTVTYRLSVTQRRIRAAEYGAFREFLVAVDAALNQEIEAEAAP